MVAPTAGQQVTRAVAALAFLALASQVCAQPGPRVYVGGSAGRFSVSADDVTGNTGAGGIFGGIASRYADVELDLMWPSSAFTRPRTGISVSFAPPGSTREEIERQGVTTRYGKRRDVGSNVSVVVVVHPQIRARVTPGVILGVTNQRVREQTSFTPLAIPPGVDPLHPSVVAREEHTTRNLGALTFGANLAFAVTPHVFLVPDVRYDFGSIGDEINNALRASIRAQWRF